MEILRLKEIELLKTLKDKKIIKILIGTRRVGKSILLAQFQNKIINEYLIDSSCIQVYDFNDKRFVKQYDWEKLLKEIEKCAIIGKMNYLFFDEIQLLDNFQDLIITLFENKKYKYDIYLTGSNSKLLSTELSTNFTGRHYDINVYPFCFKDIKTYLWTNLSNEDAFGQYMEFGGMGIIIPFINNVTETKNILNTVYADAIEKDLKYRHPIKNNVEFKKICSYFFNNIGNKISINNLAKYFHSNNESKITKVTINKYIQWMEESKLLKRINYYDIKGKRMLQTSGKLYATDIGILNANTSFNNEMNIGFKLENVVLLELLANDYEVYTFKTRNGKEIDFLAIKNEKKIYFQICKDFSSNEVFKREFENLESIRDSNRKIVLSMNKKDFVNDKGIEHKYLINWLLEKEK